MKECKVYKWKIVYTSLNDGFIYKVKFTNKDELKTYVEQLQLIGSIDSPDDVVYINLFKKKLV